MVVVGGISRANPLKPFVCAEKHQTNQVQSEGRAQPTPSVAGWLNDVVSFNTRRHERRAFNLTLLADQLINMMNANKDEVHR